MKPGPLRGRFNNSMFCRMLQIVLNEKTRSKLTIDGVFSAKTTIALKRFQAANGLFATGSYDAETEKVLGPYIEFKFLKQDDYAFMAEALNTTIPAARAIIDAQTRCDGFSGSGKVNVQFHREIFYSFLEKKKSYCQMLELSEKHPAVVSSSACGFLTEAVEYENFQRAASIDSDAAMKSCSWGRFQIMGSNFYNCGYTNVTNFVADMQHNERRQLEAMIKMIRGSSKTMFALKQLNWVAFAESHNGPSFLQRGIDTKLIAAYRKYCIMLDKAPVVETKPVVNAVPEAVPA